jgi:hypothetical protein
VLAPANACTPVLTDFSSVDLATASYSFSPQHIVEHMGVLTATLKNDYSHFGEENKSFTVTVK